MSEKSVEIRDVFHSMGHPDVTYVHRDGGRYDDLLSASLDTGGQLCLVTGPSKTGKSSLYRHVLDSRNERPVEVRCDRSQVVSDIWRCALEQLDADRINTRDQSSDRSVSAGGKVSGKFGLGWLGGISGESNTGLTKSKGQSESREKFLAEPSPLHLIPLLSENNYVLVLEDFHYLADSVKTNLFQQWKTFSDNRVSVIVLGTTHRAVDIARSNKDLVGRISQIDLSRWRRQDLEMIGQKGFEYLELKVPPAVLRLIAVESVGLPIIAQQACLQLFLDKGLGSVRVGDDLEFTEMDACNALHHLALNNYVQLEADYQQLIQGPRKRQRNFETYELLLSCFLIDPVCFSLSRPEIDERLEKMAIPQAKKPPRGSVTSTLKALENFQKKREIEMLEWNDRLKTLHVLEPSFLFYLRWRKEQSATEVMDQDEYRRLLRDWAESH